MQKSKSENQFLKMDTSKKKHTKHAIIYIIIYIIEFKTHKKMRNKN